MGRKDPPFPTHSKQSNIIHSNSQYILPHLHNLQSIVSEHNIHVLAISESFLKPGISSFTVAIPNTRLFRVDGLGNERGDGVAMYVHESIHATEICWSLQTDIYVKRPKFLFVELELDEQKILCSIIYSPPKAGHWANVEEAFMNINSAYDFICVMGDFSIDWNETYSSHTTLEESLKICQLEPLHFRPTRHLKNSYSTINYICVSDRTQVISLSQKPQPNTIHFSFTIHPEFWRSCLPPNKDKMPLL